MNKLYNIFNFPALFIHELLHVIACLLTFTPIFSVHISLGKGYVRFLRSDNRIVNFIINVSPLFAFPITGIFCLLNPLFVFLLIYLFISPSSFLSKADIDNIRNFGVDV